MEKNIIEIRLRPRKRITRRADGTAVVRIREEAVEAVEELSGGIDGEINMIDLISQLIIYAVANTEVKLVREE